jgi:hypothetical protein
MGGYWVRETKMRRWGARFTVLMCKTTSERPLRERSTNETNPMGVWGFRNCERPMAGFHRPYNSCTRDPLGMLSIMDLAILWEISREIPRNFEIRDPPSTHDNPDILRSLVGSDPLPIPRTYTRLPIFVPINRTYFASPRPLKPGPRSLRYR